MKKSEERKIFALNNDLKGAQNDRRKNRIEQFIKIYENNINLIENKNLISKKLHF